MTPTAKWISVQACVWTAILAATAWFAWRDPPAEWLIAPIGIAAAASFVSMWIVLRAGRTVADYVTAGRFLLLTVVIFVVAKTGVTWPVWAALIAIVSSDLVDGWCARRWGGTDEGAILDMETDQLATIALSVFAAIRSDGPIWILLLPAFRYTYIFYSLALGLPAHDPKPRAGDNRQARFICATVMVLLLACNMPSLAAGWRWAAAATAVIALAYSFGSDALYLFRRLVPTARNEGARMSPRGDDE